MENKKLAIIYTEEEQKQLKNIVLIGYGRWITEYEYIKRKKEEQKKMFESDTHEEI